MKKPLCIYHAKCNDGFGAAWAVNWLMPDTFEFHAAKYGDDPPAHVDDRHVLVVDFSYPLDVLTDMAKRALSVVVLDHHDTAQQDLGNLPAPYETLKECWANNAANNLWALFDMERSGAGITWDYLSGGIDRPPVIDHIEDRDLWRFKLPGTQEVHEALASYPKTMEAWDSVVHKPTVLIEEGIALMRAKRIQIKSLLDEGIERQEIFGYNVPAVNCPGWLASDVGNILCEGEPFSMTYYFTPGKIHCSLRSDTNGLHVGKLAKKRGGGGHRNAAGFIITEGQKP